jgi:hypothetical protein
VVQHAVVEKLTRALEDDFKGRNFEACLIVQGLTWHLRVQRQSRNPEEMVSRAPFRR